MYSRELAKRLLQQQLSLYGAFTYLPSTNGHSTTFLCFGRRLCRLCMHECFQKAQPKSASFAPRIRGESFRGKKVKSPAVAHFCEREREMLIEFRKVSPSPSHSSLSLSEKVKSGGLNFLPEIILMHVCVCVCVEKPVFGPSLLRLSLADKC